LTVCRTAGSTHRSRAAALLIALAIPALLSVPAGPAARADDDGSSDAPARVAVRGGVVTLTLDRTEQQNAGIETARPAAAPAQDTLPAYGEVLDAGPLATLVAAYADAASQVQTAQARLAVSRAAAGRARLLYNDRQNISHAELQAAEAALDIDQAALAAARSRLAVVSADASQNWGPVIGSALAAGAPLVARLTGRRDYLVRVTLPPGVMPAAAPATATALRPDGTGVTLRLVSAAASADPRLQGLAYFYDVAAGSGLLPGLDVSVSLLAGGQGQRPRVVVPGSAVVWLEGRPWIYLRTGPRTFIRRTIDAEQGEAGQDASDGGYVVAGLPPGAEVAVRGVQMLLSEEFRAQVDVDEDDR